MPAKKAFSIDWLRSDPRNMGRGQIDIPVMARTYAEAADLWLNSDHGISGITHIMSAKGNGRRLFAITPLGLQLISKQDDRPVFEPVKEVFLEKTFYTGSEPNYATVRRMTYTVGPKRYCNIQFMIGYEEGHPGARGIIVRKSEANLDSGRFKNFCFDDLPHHVEVDLDDYETRLMEFTTTFKGRWGIGLRNIVITTMDRHINVSYQLVLKFEDANDALLFKLSYKKPVI